MVSSCYLFYWVALHLFFERPLDHWFLAFIRAIIINKVLLEKIGKNPRPLQLRQGKSQHHKHFQEAIPRKEIGKAYFNTLQDQNRKMTKYSKAVLFFRSTTRFQLKDSPSTSRNMNMLKNFRLRCMNFMRSHHSHLKKPHKHRSSKRTQWLCSKFNPFTLRPSQFHRKKSRTFNQIPHQQQCLIKHPIAPILERQWVNFLRPKSQIPQFLCKPTPIFRSQKHQQHPTSLLVWCLIHMEKWWNKALLRFAIILECLFGRFDQTSWDSFLSRHRSHLESTNLLLRKITIPLIQWSWPYLE